jgi:LEA14-like dessication related protein
MKKHITFLISLSALVIILTASNCKESIKAPEYIGSRNLKLDALSLTGGAIKTDLEFNNVNNFGISIKETNLKIFIENEYIADAQQTNEIKVEAKKHFFFPVMAKFSPTKILPNVLKWSGRKTLNYRIEGTAKVGKGGIFIRVPVKVNDVYKL